MDEGAVRRHAERHAQALLAGDLPSAFGDLTEEAQSQLEPYVLNFPSPVEQAEMVFLAPGPEGYVVSFDISGAGRELRIETTWREAGGRPMIVAVRGVPER